MLTPQSLRVNAWSKVLSAEALIAAERWDDASYLAGYAVEFALKARFCTRNKLSHFPTDKTQVKALNKGNLFIHDLDELLKLSDGVSIKQGSLLSIDWTRAMDWSAEQRYDPIGSVSKELASTQVSETRKLVVELAMFEIVEKMVEFERSLSSEMGPFCLFLVGDRATQGTGWEVLMSAWWLNSESKNEEIMNRGAAMLDSDLAASIGYWVRRHPLDDLVTGFYRIGQFQHAPRCMISQNAVNGRFLPPAYVITVWPRPKPDSVSQ